MAHPMAAFADPGTLAAPNFAAAHAVELLAVSENSLDHAFEGIIGTSPAIQKVLEQVRTVAPTDATVLLHE